MDQTKRILALERRMQPSLSPTHLAVPDTPPKKRALEMSTESMPPPSSHPSPPHPASSSMPPPPPSSAKKKKRFYSVEEDEKIVQGVKLFGNDWAKVLEWSGLDRTKDQVASRYNRKLKLQEDEATLPTSSSDHLSEVRLQLLERERNLEERVAEIEGHWQEKCSTLVKDALIRASRAEQRLTRFVLAQKSARLGHVTNGGQTWQDGLEMIRLCGERESLRRKLDEVPDVKDGRHIAFARELALLDREHDELERAKQAHIRELRRVADEDASRFGSQPTLCNGRYVLLTLLGRGGFSEVWHAFDLKDYRDVALKIHQLDSAWSTARQESYTRHAIREYNIHRSLVHDRIVTFRDVFEIDTRSFATVLDLCRGGDLDARLRNAQGHRLPEAEARFIVAQMLDGLRYLGAQAKPVIHYDLKPANVLFDINGDAKIADFGLAKVSQNSDATSIELTSQGAGTYWYLPPEVFKHGADARISAKVDVWAVGVIFYQCVFGRRPFGHDYTSQDRLFADQVIARARAVTFPDGFDDQVSESARAFLSRLLAVDARVRPNVLEAFSDPYLVDLTSTFH